MIAKRTILSWSCLMILLFSFGNSALAADTSMGMKLYRYNCFPCHGEKGDSAGPKAASLNPRPTDFTATQASVLTRSTIEKAIVDGVPTVIDHEWRNKLELDEVNEIIQYTMSFQKQ